MGEKADTPVQQFMNNNNDMNRSFSMSSFAGSDIEDYQAAHKVLVVTIACSTRM